MGLFQTRLFERALQQPWLISLLKRIVPPLDKLLLKLSRGWVSTAMQSIVLVRVTGAKSGTQREIVTLCMPDGESIVLVGSNWGGDKHPAWVHNLRVNPLAHVIFRGYSGLVLARELAGEERDSYWQRLVSFNPQYARYQSGTSRVLPVMLLERT